MLLWFPLTCLISLPDSVSIAWSDIEQLDDTRASLSDISHQYKNRDALPLVHHKLRQKNRCQYRYLAVVQVMWILSITMIL